MIVGVLDMYQLHSIGWYRRFGAQASTKNSILTVTPLNIFLTGIEKTHLVGKCPESRQLPHGYRENTSRGEVS